MSLTALGWTKSHNHMLKSYLPILRIRRLFMFVAADRLMADVDRPLEQQVLDIPQ